MYISRAEAPTVSRYIIQDAAPPVSGTVSKVLSFGVPSLIHLSAVFAYSFFPFRST